MTLHFSPHLADIEERTGRLEQPKTRKKTGSDRYRNKTKQIFDFTLTLISLPLVALIVGVMAFLIALDGHNPFYSQMRVGKNGREFRIWKLRTMVHNADELLESYLAENPAARLEWDMTQKLKQDPRITFAGRVLRKTSLDELPQLWNVLNGTMSLVGPRPMMVNQKDSYDGEGYYRLRPGMTGLWQISERNSSSFADRVFYDDLYDETVSFKTDFVILLRTIRVVLRGTGY
ncbi:Undecaprenyl phosphate N,N'-diacetylbacillosamine 1-phosphate transferase (plasmid) [Roseobacter fucihabitans]|uniref:Undecaprenyl phosphate N,N'-diacetylbacillosamine 1-phosphate transferase n=1 Tax=Roseobacter fucihabitans TaxID=1537242 RepID=A0ABZ2C2B2_9RHOB|nr:sugar transferase [Roseobacter litoralis]MBC6966918.1 Undecaprenyl phosphate N,N'-diacetylbacillosamine 1-phosphate transferase [Roseobacter litoralis]